ncbi:MAG: hypothetical protein LBR92_00160 [Puniceicoccales bacterium]|jgi:hypothetical protein|nr:hypothetical protein [Puniceicoccales bacterium]
MGYKVCLRKMLHVLLMAVGDVALGGGYLLRGELAVTDSVEVPVATIYSPTIHCSINLANHKKLCQKAIDKCKKFKESHVLITQNTSSGIFYTFIGGLIPKKDLLLDEIDTLKVLGCGNFRSHFIQFIEKPANVKRKLLPAIQENYKNYLQKIDKYIAFFVEKFDGISQKNIQKLHEQFRRIQNNLTEGMLRVHAESLAVHLKKIDQLQLNLPGNPPFNYLRELFHPEMLLLYAMENDVNINDFHFTTLKQQNPLNIGLYSDMCLSCETLLAWFVNTTDRADKWLIVSSVNPAEHSTRIGNAQFPQYNFLPHFIKIALHETTP